jgi:hypothetical protein
MKKCAVLGLAVILGSLLVGPLFADDHKDDLQAIKKAVRQSPLHEPGRGVKWFKLLVVNDKTDKEMVKVTVPISVLEIFLRCSEDKRFRIDNGRCEVDLEAVLKELKAAGPLVILEISDNGQTVKAWLE